MIVKRGINLWKNCLLSPGWCKKGIYILGNRQSTRLKDARQPRRGWEAARGGAAGKQEAGRRGGGKKRRQARLSKQAGGRTAGQDHIIACRENTSHENTTSQQAVKPIRLLQRQQANGSRQLSTKEPAEGAKPSDKKITLSFLVKSNKTY